MDSRLGLMCDRQESCYRYHLASRKRRPMSAVRSIGCSPRSAIDATRLWRGNASATCYRSHDDVVLLQCPMASAHAARTRSGPDIHVLVCRVPSLPRRAPPPSKPVRDRRAHEACRVAFDLMADDRVFLAPPAEAALEFHVAVRIEERRRAHAHDAGRVLLVTGIETALLHDVALAVLQHAVHRRFQQVVHGHEVEAERIDVLDGDVGNAVARADVRIHLPAWNPPRDIAR